MPKELKKSKFYREHTNAYYYFVSAFCFGAAIFMFYLAIHGTGFRQTISYVFVAVLLTGIALYEIKELINAKKEEAKENTKK